MRILWSDLETCCSQCLYICITTLFGTRTYLYIYIYILHAYLADGWIPANIQKLLILATN